MNAPAATLTKRELVEKGVEALDPAKYAEQAVAHQPAHGVSQVNLPQVVEIAKFMAVAGEGVPNHCRANVGICLRLTFQAVEWQMSPFSVADMSYIVNGRLAYMSQLIHAVVEARAPIQKRLDCKYEGEGPTRTCTVIGHFISGDTREYTTPEFKDIKVKNSPLWTQDPDQQLFYYASRSWARKWCPDVLLGVYTREEMAEVQPFDPQAGSGLHERLSAGTRSTEGHSPQHAIDQLNTVAGSGGVIEHEPTPEAPDTDGKGKKKKKSAESKAAPKEQEPAPPSEVITEPKTAAQYVDYARAWIVASTDVDTMNKRWDSERPLRNTCGLTAEERQPIMNLMVDKRTELKG